MSRPLEITLGESFRRFSSVYLQTFPLAFVKYGGDAEDYAKYFAAYTKLIEDKFPELCRMAAAQINAYLNLYGVHANKSADEFKIIYFLGRAIEKHIAHQGLDDLARMHMFSMVGLLDYRIRTLGYEKKVLVRVLLKLVRLGKLDDQLGPTGCYLVFKCSSTAIRKRAAIGPDGADLETVAA